MVDADEDKDEPHDKTIESEDGEDMTEFDGVAFFSLIGDFTELIDSLSDSFFLVSFSISTSPFPNESFRIFLVLFVSSSVSLDLELDFSSARLDFLEFFLAVSFLSFEFCGRLLNK